MLAAYTDKTTFLNKVFADKAEKNKKEKYYCPICEEEVILCHGKKVSPYFRHEQKTDCKWDSDGKTDWHISMQNLFPQEMQEVIFKDNDTGEKHIADIYDKEHNLIIEFQHSPISDEEFKSRTDFHLKEGRRIVWVFDERKIDENGNVIPPNEEQIGKLKLHEIFYCNSAFNVSCGTNYGPIRLMARFPNFAFSGAHKRSCYKIANDYFTNQNFSAYFDVGGADKLLKYYYGNYYFICAFYYFDIKNKEEFARQAGANSISNITINRSGVYEFFDKEKEIIKAKIFENQVSENVSIDKMRFSYTYDEKYKRYIFMQKMVYIGKSTYRQINPSASFVVELPF